MQIKGERKEMVWTLTLSDSEMASLYTLLHEAYDPVTASQSCINIKFKEVQQQTLLDHRHNIGEFLRKFNEEADRVDKEYPHGG